MRTRWIGEVSVTRVEEVCGPGFEPAFLFKDWSEAVLEEHAAWMIPDCYDPVSKRFIASIHTWVLRTRSHTILVDTCTGNDKERPQFARFHRLSTAYYERLLEAGVDPLKVDYVLCTHLHVDHCGWNTRLIDGRWTPTFPNAKYVFSRKELDHWSGAEGREGFNAGVFEDSVRPILDAGQELIVDGDYELGDGLLIEPAPGHTEGHVTLRLLSKGAEGIFTGDIMHQPIQVYRPEWNSCFCAAPEAARATRRRILEYSAEANALVLPGHFAGTHAGRVGRRGDRFFWAFD